MTTKLNLLESLGVVLVFIAIETLPKGESGDYDTVYDEALRRLNLEAAKRGIAYEAFSFADAVHDGLTAAGYENPLDCGEDSPEEWDAAIAASVVPEAWRPAQKTFLN
jgi:hypothetical protein